jgi:hypothetical protein
LGISDTTVRKIAAQTKLKEFIPSPKGKIPAYEDKETQLGICIAWWEIFFGEQAQTSDGGHIYFPVNASFYHLYFNNFFPWWLEHSNYLIDENLENNPRADQELADAIALLEIESAEDMDKYFQDSDDAIEDSDSLPAAQNLLPEDEPPVFLSPGQLRVRENFRMSPEMKAFVSKHPNLLSDALMEQEVMKNLKHLQRELDCPSYATLLRALHTEKFANVKKREKHFHCRCGTCEKLIALLHHAKDAESRARYESLRKAHHFEVKHWRQLEVSLQAKAKRAPEQVTVLSYDDTTAMGFPRPTNRAPKQMATDKVELVPWNCTNHGTGENIYVYDLKKKWRHGANRLCTNLYHIIRRIKLKDDATCTTAERGQKVCRKLVLMGDNVSENKNNTLFAFCQHLVEIGWYDEVELLFGPVGHTHNGNDAVHFVHNNLVGNFVSITPAEFFIHYKDAWRNEKTRPTPIVAEVQFNWDEYYAPFINPISNFANRGTKNPDYVRAFRFFKNFENECEMVIKGSPSAAVWHGANSVAGAPGFKMLNGVPDGCPLFNRPSEFKIRQEFMNGLKNQNVELYCRSHELLPM